MRTKIAFGLVAVLVGSSAAHAAEFWEKKDYRTWTEKECRKLLADSPWARQKVFSQTLITPLGAPPLAESPGAIPGAPAPAQNPVQRDAAIRGREDNPRMLYQVQLLSAPPIRQAIVRLQQLQMDYDNLPEKEQQNFDAEAENYLTADFSETVVVQVFYGSNVPDDNQEITRHWQNQTTRFLKNFVYLIGGKGTKAPLLQYTVVEGGGRMFRMVFPREVDGRPLVGPKDKSLKLEFPHPRIRGQREERVLLEFKLKKMRMEGEVVF